MEPGGPSRLFEGNGELLQLGNRQVRDRFRGLMGVFNALCRSLRRNRRGRVAFGKVK